MYGTQDELNMMAQAAKSQLSNQQTGSTEDLYASVMGEDVQEGYAPVSSTPANVENDQAGYQEFDEEMVMRNINAPAPSLDPFDEELFPGGPRKSQINLWKKEWEGYDIYVTEILKETFVFRTLNRYEYKQLISFTDINALQREETICNTVTLWPIDYSYEVMATTKAGIPSTYAEIIMEKSGFTKDFALQEI